MHSPFGDSRCTCDKQMSPSPFLLMSLSLENLSLSPSAFHLSSLYYARQDFALLPSSREVAVAAALDELGLI